MIKRKRKKHSKQVKISFNRDGKYISWEDVLGVLFGYNIEAKAIANKFIDLILADENKSISRREWVKTIKSIRPDLKENTTEWNNFQGKYYSVIRKLLNAGLIRRDDENYYLSEKFALRLEQIAYCVRQKFQMTKGEVL